MTRLVSRSRRGQAAMEFLTTYGWAMMVILVMIGALAYFGVLNPTLLVPDRCVSSADFSCLDYELRAPAGGIPTVSVAFGNGVGRTIYLEQITCEYQGQSVTGSAIDRGSGEPVVTGDAWSPRAQIIASCDVPALAGLAGQKARVTMLVAYRRSATGFIHEGTADVTGSVIG